MTETSDNWLEADVCIIGAGSGGLSVAAGAAQLGLRTALIERDRMGGDCLNSGCVPSKALIAAANAAHAIRNADRFGIAKTVPVVNWASVNDHVKDVIASIAPHDSRERFEGMGVTVIEGEARFSGRQEVTVGGKVIRARRFVIATGSRPAIPPIPGLANVPYMTNETLFDNRAPVTHLAIIGGGPIGMEMAQAHARLGAKVTVLEAGQILSREDRDAVLRLKAIMEREGVTFLEGCNIHNVGRTDDGISLSLSRSDGGLEEITASHLLVAAGRKPNIEGLQLDKAGIGTTSGGIRIDRRLRTDNRKIFAIGDVAGGMQFTHLAGYQAGIVIRQIAFAMFWARADREPVPQVTFTAPELARVGLSVSEAQSKLGKDRIRVLSTELKDNDRNRAEKGPDGFFRIVTDRKGRVLGATILAQHAGDLLFPWIEAVRKQAKISTLTGMIVPYPTLGEATVKAAGSFYTPRLFSDRMRQIVGFLSKIAP